MARSSPMIVLALDTCLGACSAAVVDGERVIAAIAEPMTRGHQERLAPMVRDLMSEAGVAFADLGRIGVTVGPGSFTGLRVGLAFAKGLALALDRPCVGVGTLEALAASVRTPGHVAAVIDAGRRQIYLQIFDAGQAVMAPDVLPVETAAARLAELHGGQIILVGPGAALLGGIIADAGRIDLAAPGPETIARLASAASLAPARPLYLRAPDAKPPSPKLRTR